MCEYSIVLLGVCDLLNVYLYNFVVIMNVWELEHCYTDWDFGLLYGSSWLEGCPFGVWKWWESL